MEYGFKPTTNGRALIAACGALEQPLVLTRVAFGSGKIDEENNLADQHTLVQYVADGTIGERRHENDRLYLSVQYSNKDHPDQGAFNLGEFLIYARDPDTQEETDVAYATMGDYQQPVPSYNKDLPASVFTFPMVLVVSDDIKVVIEAPPGLVTYDDLQKMLNEGVIGICRTEITIPTEGWEQDSREDMEDEPHPETAGGSTDYPYHLDLPIETVKALMTPHLTIYPESLSEAKVLCPTCESKDGALRLLARSAPKAEIKGSLALLGGAGYIAIPE